jgi:hypothetical protein
MIYFIQCNFFITAHTKHKVRSGSRITQRFRLHNTVKTVHCKENIEDAIIFFGTFVEIPGKISNCSDVLL